MVLALGLVLLVVVPQYRIFVSSSEQELGKAVLRRESDGSIAHVPSSTAGFEMVPEGNGMSIARNGLELLAVRPITAKQVILTPMAGDDITAEIVDDKQIKLVGSGFDLVLTQETFRTSIFGPVVKPDPLAIVEAQDGQIVISHADNAYLTFVDSKPTHGLGNFRTFLTRSRYVDAIKNSLIVAVGATAIATVLAVSLAYFFARYNFPGKQGMVTLITMASISPPFLGGYAWRMLLGSQGVLTRLLGLNFTIVGLHGVIWVINWLIFPLIFLMTYDSFTAIDNTLIESSMSLGADKRKTLFRVIIPLAMPGIITGVYLGLMTAFSDFGTPYVISLNLNVLPVLVYQEFMNEVGTNFPIASTGSVIMIAISSAILMAQRIYLATKSYASIASKSIALINPPRRVKAGIVSYAAVLIFMAFVPHLTVIITSFLQWSSGIVRPIFTLGNYERLFNLQLSSIYVSLFLGIVTTILNVVIGVAIAYIIVRKRYRIVSNLLNLMVMIPYIVPGTVLAIGFIMIFNQPPLLLTGTWAILVLAYFVRKLPYSVKTAEAVLYQIHPDLEEAAKSLGAKPAKSFYDVTLKLMLGGVISGATLSFLQIMTEISSTIILYRPPWKPMTAVIFENTTRAGSDFGVASAMTVILMLIVYVPLYLITKKTRMNSKGEETFATYN
jgi:iron(III) transport system permease protein